VPRGMSRSTRCTEAVYRHEDGRRVRLFCREWREGDHPKYEGLIWLSFQPYITHGNATHPDAVNPLWAAWTFPDCIPERVAMVLGPGWENILKERTA